MAKRLVIKPEACIGCKSCALICAFDRSGEFCGSGSAITVFEYRDEGIAVVMMCMQCNDALCLTACKFGALTRDENTGVIAYCADKCVMCGMCVSICPLGNIRRDELRGSMVKCTLCDGGRPKCVSVCPVSAIEFLEISDDRVT